jgi:aspartate/tyrosine/aromatic aminotransferase
MASVEEQVQALAGNQPMMLYRLDQADEHRAKIDDKLEVLPVLTSNQLDYHARIVALEKATKKQADHQKGSKTRQVATVGGTGAAALGLSQIDKILELLATLFGG